MLVNTPYDDVFRTLLNDCSSLIIPVVNEIFHESYSGDEAVEFYPNEHFVNGQNGTERERITDSCFGIRDRLEGLAESGKLTEYVKRTLEEMSGKVLEHVARGHEKVREGVKSIMGGRVLEYEAKTILREGIALGRNEGIASTARRMLAPLPGRGRGAAERATVKLPVRPKDVIGQALLAWGRLRFPPPAG